MTMGARAAILALLLTLALPARAAELPAKPKCNAVCQVRHGLWKALRWPVAGFMRLFVDSAGEEYGIPKGKRK